MCCSSSTIIHCLRKDRAVKYFPERKTSEKTVSVFQSIRLQKGAPMNSEMKRRLAMTVAGVLIAGFSVGMFQYSAMGLDPFQVFAHGVWKRINGPSFGFVYMVLNMLLLAVDFFFLDRKKIGIATFINLFLLGYVVDFSAWLWKSLLPDPSFLIRLFFLIMAVVIMCLASALYFTGDLGVSTYDAIALTLSEKKGWDFRIVRVISDLICTLTGTLLGVMPGIGTIITAFFMGPLIAFFRKTVADPLRYGKSGMPH